MPGEKCNVLQIQFYPQKIVRVWKEFSISLTCQQATLH